MLTLNDLKYLLFEEWSRSDKVLLLLASLDAPCKICDIRKRANVAGFRDLAKWNVSDILRRTKGLALNTSEGWEISERGSQRLLELGLIQQGSVEQMSAMSLREMITRIGNDQVRSFIEEAAICYENGQYRAAIIMSWVGAVAILRNKVSQRYHQEFVDYLREHYQPKKKNSYGSHTLERIADGDFLEVLHGISLIDKAVKMALKECLDYRNQCSHPNELKIGSRTVEKHFEVLILNVYAPAVEGYST